MQEKLSKFTSFYTRYYKSDYGAESAEWLYQQISDIIAPVKDTVTISKVEHKMETVFHYCFHSWKSD